MTGLIFSNRYTPAVTSRMSTIARTARSAYEMTPISSIFISNTTGMNMLLRNMLSPKISAPKVAALASGDDAEMPGLDNNARERSEQAAALRRNKRLHHHPEDRYGQHDKDKYKPSFLSMFLNNYITTTIFLSRRLTPANDLFASSGCQYLYRRDQA